MAVEDGPHQTVNENRLRAGAEGASEEVYNDGQCAP